MRKLVTDTCGNEKAQSEVQSYDCLARLLKLDGALDKPSDKPKGRPGLDKDLIKPKALFKVASSGFVYDAEPRRPETFRKF